MINFDLLIRAVSLVSKHPFGTALLLLTATSAAQLVPAQLASVVDHDSFNAGHIRPTSCPVVMKCGDTCHRMYTAVIDP